MFFCDFEPGLRDAVRDGRRREFAHFAEFRDAAARDRIPDPTALATFDMSRLDWAEPAKEPHADLLDWHRRLIALRRDRPELTDGRLDRVRCRFDQAAAWFVLYRQGTAVVCNLAKHRQTVPFAGTPSGVLAASAPGFLFRPSEVELDPQSAAIVTFVDNEA